MWTSTSGRRIGKGRNTRIRSMSSGSAVPRRGRLTRNARNTKEAWITALKAGEHKRIIGARIDEPGLIAIREHDLPNLLSLEEVEDAQAANELENQIRRFMKDRLKEGPPYFRAISGLPHWGDQEKHSFRIYSDHNAEPYEIKSKIEEFLPYRASAYISHRVLSISYRDNIGVYIDKPDEALILSWAGQSASDDDEHIISRSSMRMKDSAKRYTRLVYARLAEKTAMSIYSSLSNETVEDCSILQTGGKDNRWRDFDIWGVKMRIFSMVFASMHLSHALNRGVHHLGRSETSRRRPRHRRASWLPGWCSWELLQPRSHGLLLMSTQ